MTFTLGFEDDQKASTTRGKHEILEAEVTRVLRGWKGLKGNEARNIAIAKS